MTKIVSNGFERIFKTSFQELQIKKDFCDMTLACEEYQIETHKIIISTNSPALRNILKLNQNPHPVIYLRGVKYKDLQHLLNFMYQGEVNINNEDLYSFLELSKDLKVKGLNEEKKEEIAEEYLPQSKNLTGTPNLKRKRNLENSIENLTKCEYSRNSEISTRDSQQPPGTAQNKSPKKEKNKSKKKITKSKIKNKDVDIINESKVDEDLNNKELLELEVSNDDLNSTTKFLNVFEDVDNFLEMPSSIVDDDNGKLYPQFTNNIQSELVKQENSTSKFICVKCTKTFATSGSLTRHIQSVHDGAQFPCSQCDYKATQKSNLKIHISSVHEGSTFSCNLCDYKISQKSNLKVHMMRKHSCKHCDYQEATKYDLNMHMKSVHEVPLHHISGSY